MLTIALAQHDFLVGDIQGNLYKALEAAGVTTVRSPADLGGAISQRLKGSN